jgi:hypothetical protein
MDFPLVSQSSSICPNDSKVSALVPVLLVVIVPQLVPLKFVSTALGAHKSVSVSSLWGTIQ